MKDLFISYSSKDADLAAAFIRDFEHSGITHWIDVENLYKDAGREFGGIIKDNINDSRAFMLIYTPNSMKSEYVKSEFEHAILCNKTILCFPYFPDSHDANYNRHREFSKYLDKVQWLCNTQQIDRIDGLREYLQGAETLKDLSSLIQEPAYAFENRFANDVILARIGIQICLNKPLSAFGTFTSFINNNEVFKEDNIRFHVLNKSFYVQPLEGTEDRIRPFLEKAETWHPLLTEYNRDYEIDSHSLFDKMRRVISEKGEFNDKETDAIIEEAKLMTIEVIAKEMEGKELMFNGPMVGVYDIIQDRIPGQEDTIVDIQLYQSDYFTFKFTGELYHLLKKKIRKGLDFQINYGNVKEYAPFLCSLGFGGFVIVRHGQEEYLLWTKRSDMIQAKNMWHFSYDETVHLFKDLILDDANTPVRTQDGDMILSQSSMFERALREELRLNTIVSNDYRKGVLELGLIECDRLELELLSYVVIEADPSQDLELQLKKYTDTAKDKIEWSKISYIPFDMESIKKELHGKFLTPESLALAEHLLLQKEENALY